MFANSTTKNLNKKSDMKYKVLTENELETISYEYYYQFQLDFKYLGLVVLKVLIIVYICNKDLSHP